MAKLEIEDFVYDLLQEHGCKAVRKHKDSITAQCPYHWNKSNFKTFRVSTVEVLNKRTNIIGYHYHCFSCGAGGSIVSLISHINRCTIKKAEKIFRKRVILKQVTLDGIRKELRRLNEENDIKELEEVSLPAFSKNQEPMMRYLKRRNKTYHGTLDLDYIINKYELYYCSSGWYAGRIVMPVRDVSGKVVYFNDRTIDDSIKNKSLHQDGSLASQVLHGIRYAHIKKKCVICEGSFDMFAVDCAIRDKNDLGRDYGIVNLMGLVVSDIRLSMLVNHFEEVYWMLDNDKDGIKATRKFMKEFKDDLEMRNCTQAYPENKDPGKCTKKEIRRAISKPYINKNRKPYLEYFLDKNRFRV